MSDDGVTCGPIRLREHHAAAARLFVDSYAQPPWSEGWSLELATRRLDEIAWTPGCISAGAFADDHLVGFAAGASHTGARGRSLYLMEVAVAPAWQSLGLGSRLLGEMQRLAAEAGHVAVWLVTARASATTRFYVKGGFEEPDDLMIVTKDLSA